MRLFGTYISQDPIGLARGNDIDLLEVKMKEIIDYSHYKKSLEYYNKVNLDEYNILFSKKKVDVIFEKVSLLTHPQRVILSIGIDEKPIVRLCFNFLRKFYGYSDKWENVSLEIFKQEELLSFKEVPNRNLVMSLYILYDKDNDFIIKSSNLYEL